MVVSKCLITNFQQLKGLVRNVIQLTSNLLHQEEVVVKNRLYRWALEFKSNLRIFHPDIHRVVPTEKKDMKVPNMTKCPTVINFLMFNRVDKVQLTFLKNLIKLEAIQLNSDQKCITHNPWRLIALRNKSSVKSMLKRS